MGKLSGCANIIGLGNILAGDDGFGVLALKKLGENYSFPPSVHLIEGGAQGPSLYAYIEEAEKLLVLDAVDFGQNPGSLIFREGQDVPLWLGAKKISPHQNSFSELLALAFLKDTLPRRIALVGVQPLATRFGETLSTPVIAGMDIALRKALEYLTEWGIFPQRSDSRKNTLNERKSPITVWNSSGNGANSMKMNILCGSKGED